MITFDVYGKPQPQGSTKYVGHRNGRPVLISDNPKLKSWRLEVGRCASRLHAAMAKPLSCDSGDAIQIHMVFTFILPKAAKGRVHHTVKPDLDKLERAVFDSLSGILWHDDAQVVSVYGTKKYGPKEGVHITVKVVKQGDY
jgi:Holliday junction resolvase RusA-like endonuclease